MSAQVVGDAVERVRFGEEVDPTILIGVHAVGEDVGGHELAQADCPVDRPPDFERIEAVQVGQAEQRPELVVGPVALLAAAARAMLASRLKTRRFPVFRPRCVSISRIETMISFGTP
ncbi:MAG: hypothetical protein NTY86_13730 [Deltaproteobacteria bacterium]|nr:hypothetical protein [Deltaproteobacteria bacterium]